MRVDWSEYLRVHANRRNLLIHLVAVPLFVVAALTLSVALMTGNPVSAITSLVFALFAMVLQGRGHRLEANPPRPFTGPGNFLRRWFTEQFVIFPVFVLSGRWIDQYRKSTSQSENPARHES